MIDFTFLDKSIILTLSDVNVSSCCSITRMVRCIDKKIVYKLKQHQMIGYLWILLPWKLPWYMMLYLFWFSYRSVSPMVACLSKTCHTYASTLIRLSQICICTQYQPDQIMLTYPLLLVGNYLSKYPMLYFLNYDFLL
jgi:hypothetical protein